jgi:hypothetical protein
MKTLEDVGKKVVYPRSIEDEYLWFYNGSWCNYFNNTNGK